MPLGTLDRRPPPLFRQGPSALTRLAFFSALALFLMVADTRFALIAPLRDGIAMALLPAQRTLAVPVQAVERSFEYLKGLQRALANERAAREKLARQSEQAARADRLDAENKRLRALLDLRASIEVRSRAAEVLIEAADPYTRKVFIDAGTTQGVAVGSPVINEAGVLGQVTRVYPLSAEVTLLADKDAAIPVLNARTQQRSAAYGGVVGAARAVMELRFVSANADVQVGDLLATSGVDGVYPGGLPVARVSAIDRKTDSSFARVLLTPAADPDGVRHVLVLEPLAAQLPPRAPPEPVPGPERARRAPKR
jgi:rod shape-determining protein MreC